MSFIRNDKLKEIRIAAANGNEKAKVILQALRKFSPQSDLDRMVEEYYHVDLPEENVEVKEPEIATEEEKVVENEQPIIEEKINDNILLDNVSNEDINSILDNETDGLWDEVEVPETSFTDFLKNKKRDKKREFKNAEYFRSFAPEDRQKYAVAKIDGYKKKFDGRLGNIDRKYKDINTAIDKYQQSVHDMLDDEVELNNDYVVKAYDKIVDDEPLMNSFGRYWDEDDVGKVLTTLDLLIKEFGKKNVIAAINILKNDNDNYKSFLDNQIDTEIGRYTKSIERLFN